MNEWRLWCFAETAERIPPPSPPQLPTLTKKKRITFFAWLTIRAHGCEYLCSVCVFMLNVWMLDWLAIGIGQKSQRSTQCHNFCYFARSCLYRTIFPHSSEAKLTKADSIKCKTEIKEGKIQLSKQVRITFELFNVQYWMSIFCSFLSILFWISTIWSLAVWWTFCNIEMGTLNGRNFLISYMNEWGPTCPKKNLLECWRQRWQRHRKISGNVSCNWAR